MKIVTYNINWFRKEKTNVIYNAKTKKSYDKYEIEHCNYEAFDNICNYIKHFFNENSDEDCIAILEEVPYCCGKYSQKHEYYKMLLSQFNNDEFELVHKKVSCNALRITVAIVKKNSRFKKSYSFKPTVLEYLYTEIEYKGTIIIGVHMHDDMWDELIKYLEDKQDKKIIIVGDFNAYKECNKCDSFTKEYNKLISNNLFDTVNETTTIYNTPIDHILVSKSSLKNCSLSKVDKSASFSDHYPVICDINL